jgi:hypothetical protein
MRAFAALVTLLVGHSAIAQTPPAEPTTIDVADTAKWFVGGGAIYLPVDNGLTAVSAWGGRRLVSGPLESRFGGRLAFGDGKYSTAVSIMPEVGVVRWWNTFGLGATGGIGPIIASPKLSGGWDGVLLGLLVSASVRLRFGKIEPSLDIGVLYAVANDYPAPFALLSLTGKI